MNIFKKKTAAQELITFNKEKISKDLGEISDKLHLYRDDEGAKVLIELIRIAKNGAILNCAGALNEQERIAFQAKVSVYGEIQVFIETAMNKKIIEKKEGRKPVTGTFNAFRKIANQAGSSI